MRPDEYEELARRFDQHERFNAWVDQNYPALHAEAAPWFSHAHALGYALDHWHAELLGEIRSGTLPGMEERG